MGQTDLSCDEENVNKMIGGNKELAEFETGKIKVSSQITFLYFDDVQKAKNFFGEVLGFEVACVQGNDYCIVYKSSNSSFVGVVDRSRGSVKATTRDGVLTSFVVDNLDSVYERLKKLNLNELSELQKIEELNIKTVKFTGPEGYRFEVEEFLDIETRKYFY